MNSVFVFALAIALVASALALAREVRLRKALEKVLKIILSRWRVYVNRSCEKDMDPVDRDFGPDEWL